MTAQDALAIEEFNAAWRDVLAVVPRCWDPVGKRFCHLVSPTTLAMLASGELKHAPCVNCGTVISA